MAARRQYTYRRRVPQGERNMDPEQNATDGIEEEERRELPESTQLVKEVLRNQIGKGGSYEPNGTGGSSGPNW
ncbi:hypothetical protein M5K25_009249 [Dendrobium thyrsiflorum]|uniref:Uncharacterized protein n=1 Tax=Dendrobium thyrsiflorum TaxID=117978 RepID=A0ABD0VCB2_DENTH